MGLGPNPGLSAPFGEPMLEVIPSGARSQQHSMHPPAAAQSFPHGVAAIDQAETRAKLVIAKVAARSSPR
jgi:hypothetical protein